MKCCFWYKYPPWMYLRFAGTLPADIRTDDEAELLKELASFT